MKELSKPNFENPKYGAGGGLPIIKGIWERFGFSYLFSSIDKHSGMPPWKLVFAYISGLIANSSSVNKIAEYCNDAPVLKEILGGIVPSQSVLSRFFRLSTHMGKSYRFFVGYLIIQIRSIFGA